MIAKKKEFSLGAGMLVAFVVILVLMFTPVFDGQNGLEYLDALYNSISKGSAYYIPKVKKETDHFTGNSVDVTLVMNHREQAQQSGKLFMKSGALVNVSENELKVRGDLGKILANALEDADKMYYNDGNYISDKYGYEEKRVLYNWWSAFKAMESDLKNQKKFKEAKVVALTVKKAVETSYNYYGIQPQDIMDRLGIVVFSLVFYVVYTLWYGFAVMFMFEGWGMQLEH